MWRDMMLSTKRRIALDERARVPFAVLALTIFLLSSFSVAYMGAVTRQEMINDLLRSDLRSVDDIAVQLQNELHSVIHIVCVDTLWEVLGKANSRTLKDRELDLRVINATFQELLRDSLSRQFPRRISGHLIEESEHRINMFPRIERTLVLVPADPVSMNTSQTYGLTNATSSYLASGYINLTLYSKDSDLRSNRTLWLEREIDVPFPFLLNKMNTFQSNSVGSFSDISRLIEYILTTLAQFKAFQGYGVNTKGMPSEIVQELRIVGHDATELLTLEDVELAVNLAILLETAKTFRTWDSQSAGDLHELLLKYSSGGTIDAADLALIFLKEDEGLNLEMILAQAMCGVLDQFVLKYLDYTGLMPLADQVWRGVQTVDGVLQTSDGIIEDIWDWFAGSSARSWNDILLEWLVENIVEKGGLENDLFLRLMVGDRSKSDFSQFNGEVIDSFPSLNLHETGFTVEFVVRQTGDYHIWFTNGTELPHRYALHADDSIVGYDYVIFTIEMTFDSPDHLIEFEEVNIGEGVDQSSMWLDFFEMYFTREDQERSTAESIRDSVREVALEIAKDAIRRVGGLLSDHESVISLDPKDEISFLAELRQESVSAMDEIAEFYASPTGKTELKKILTSFTNGNLALLEDLKSYLLEEYDNFVNRSSVLQSVTKLVTTSLLENHSSSDVVNSEIVENSNDDFDWSFEGNVTVIDLPVDEIRRVFREGGANSQEQITNLLSALLDDIDLAYQQVKEREVAVGGTQVGVLIQAIETAAGKASQDAVSLFVGGVVDFMDGSGFLDLAVTAVENFLGGMLEGAEASNSQHLLPLLVGESFEFWEGDHQTASRTDTTKTVSLQVDQLVDTLPAQWSNVDSTTEAPEGLLYVDFNPKGFEDGDTGYDSGDILGKHYTDLMTFTERPFETKWNLTIIGRVPIHVRTIERTLLGPGGHRPIWLNQSFEIKLSTTIVVYTGWALEGVDYDKTNELLADIIDFLNIVWETMKEPLMDAIDYFQRISDFFREVLRTLLEYGSQAIEAVANATDIVLHLLQVFLSNVLTVASDIMMNFLKDFGLEHFFIEFAGFTFEVRLTDGGEKEDCQCGMWVRARGDMIGFDLDFTTYLIEFEEPVEGIERYLMINGSVGFGSGGIANVTIDPLFLIHPHMVEVHATDLNAEGDGWALDLYTPELDIYKNSEISLSETIGFVPTIPIPMLGVEVGVDFGVIVKHRAPDPGTPPFDFKLAMYGMLRESFIEAWQEIEMSFTLDFLEEFIRTATNKLIERLHSKLEETILEVVFYVDLAVGAIGSGGAVGGGFRLGFVVDRTILFEFLHWLVETVETFVANLHDPFGQSPYASLPKGLPEYLGVRFEVYIGVGYPKMLKKLLSSQSPKKMDLAVSIQPNVPALMMLAGVDWGRWKIDFGVYLENFPLSSLSKAYTLSKGSVVDLYILQGQIHEVC
jgi:hypothetical protein